MPDQIIIIGAGPYGVSTAAHLRNLGVSFRIFGKPMHRWLAQMPRGMFLKSESFASNLSDPMGRRTLEEYCAEAGLAYPSGSTPVPLETFSRYALSFQKHCVPMVEDVLITVVDRRPDGYILQLSSGEEVRAEKVVVATGMSYTEYVPPELGALPSELLSHCAGHRELNQFKGRDIIVVGAGQSALETAALLNEVQANVRIVVRGSTVQWNPTPAPRSPWQRVLHPAAPLGNGRQSWFFSNMPQLFYHLPEGTRLDMVGKAFGPAGAWWLRDRVIGRLPLLISHSIRKAQAHHGKVLLQVHGTDGNLHELAADHVIAGTGYRFAAKVLPFLSKDILRNLSCVEEVPVLSPHFESSVPGLYFTGLAAANQFGPVMRFVYGAHFTAKRLVRHLAKC